MPENRIDLNFIDNKKRPLVLIFPGGAYSYTSPREAKPVADKFNLEGYHTGIYYYRESKLVHPHLINEVEEKVLELLKHELIESIILCGFSAGGHLALHLSSILKEKIKCSILCYPVITSKLEYSHKQSFINLLGENYSPSNLEKVDLVNLISNDISPVFIWHTMEDTAVPVEGSIEYFYELKRRNLETEAHFFQSGGHGLSLCTKETPYDNIDIFEFEKKYEDVSLWFKLAIHFIKRNIS